jgi:hypothetical protein
MRYGGPRITATANDLDSPADVGQRGFRLRAPRAHPVLPIAYGDGKDGVSLPSLTTTIESASETTDGGCWLFLPPGRPEGLHLQPPTEPCVNLSTYTATAGMLAELAPENWTDR